MPDYIEYVLATRPWSFTAAIVPIAITAAVSRVSFVSEAFLRAMAMGITVQAGANLTNTYFDFLNGVDSKDNGERTLVEGKISSSAVLFMSISSYIVGIASILPYLKSPSTVYLLLLFVLGILLAFFYTANPIGLKYKGLGDLTIFLCFGPLLMQFCSILFTGDMNNNLNLYAIPIGLLTEQILHVNNVRDKKSDERAGIKTLVSILGDSLSYILFVLLFVGAYLSVVYIGCYHHWGCLSSLFTIPMALAVDKNYRNGAMSEIPNEVAQLHLPFGILMLVGIVFTSKGLL